MVIAVTLVAMLAVSIYGVFRISIQSWKRGTDSIDANQRHRTILDLVKKQMASTYGLIAPVDPQTGGAIYPLFAGTETTLQFISLTSLRFHENPGLTIVSYDVLPGERGNYALVEKEEQYMGFDPDRESFLMRTDARAIEIFDNLVSFMFEYFDPGDNQRPAEWLRAWNAKEMGRLPTAISMTMISHDAEGGRFSRHLVVPVMAKPYDPRLRFANPFEQRRRRIRASGTQSRN
jgi:hypothetical protein